MKTRITEQFLARFVVELGSTMTKGVQSFAMFNTVFATSDSGCQFKLNFFFSRYERRFETHCFYWNEYHYLRPR